MMTKLESLRTFKIRVKIHDQIILFKTHLYVCRQQSNRNISESEARFFSADKTDYLDHSLSLKTLQIKNRITTFPRVSLLYLNFDQRARIRTVPTILLLKNLSISCPKEKNEVKKLLRYNITILLDISDAKTQQHYTG